VATSNPENVCVAPSINRSHQEKLLQSSRTYLRFCAARDTAVGVDRLAHDRRNLAFRCDGSSDHGMDCPATPGSVSVRRRAICCGISVEFGFDFSRGDLGYREVGAPHSPRLRAHIERRSARFVASVCTLSTYCQQCGTQLALDKNAAEPRLVQEARWGSIVAIPLLGGLHLRYERRAPERLLPPLYRSIGAGRAPLGGISSEHPMYIAAVQQLKGNSDSVSVPLTTTKACRPSGSDRGLLAQSNLREAQILAAFLSALRARRCRSRRA